MKAPKLKRKKYAEGGQVDTSMLSPEDLVIYNSITDPTAKQAFLQSKNIVGSVVPAAKQVMQTMEATTMPEQDAGGPGAETLLGTGDKAAGINKLNMGIGLGATAANSLLKVSGVKGEGADVASSALSGAATGAALGPWGAAAGALVSGVSSFLGAENAKKEAETARKKAISDTQYSNGKNSMETPGAITGLAQGGQVKGAGGPKSDSIETTLAKGSFVVPAENASIAQTLRETYFGENGKIKMKAGGTVPVALSNGEHVFTPEEATALEAEGINLDLLAPNQKDSYGRRHGGKISFSSDLAVKGGKGDKGQKMSNPSNKLAEGGRAESFDADEYLDNPYVQHYLEALSELEADPKKPLTGGTKVDKNKDGKPDSSAKGQFQFTKATRDSILEKYGYDAWKEDASEQKKAAVALINDTGALDLVKDGHYSKADAKLNKQWPSLPGGSQATTKHLSSVMERRQGNINAIKAEQKPSTSLADLKKTPPGPNDGYTVTNSDQYGKVSFTANPPGEKLVGEDSKEVGESAKGKFATRSPYDTGITTTPAKTEDPVKVRDLEWNPLSGQWEEVKTDGKIKPIEAKSVTGEKPLVADSSLLKQPSGPGYQSPEKAVTETSPANNVFKALGGWGGLLALGQTGFGLAAVLSNEDKSKPYTPDETLIKLRNEAITDSNAMDPAIKANAETNLELTRRGQVEVIDQAAGGDTGLMLSNIRRAGIDKSRGIVDLAAQEEQTRLQKKGFAANLAGQVAADKRYAYSTDTSHEDFIRNQTAAANLMNTGITNLLKGTEYASFEKRLDEQDAKWSKVLGTPQTAVSQSTT